LPQAPQFVVLFNAASQPSAERALQSPKPALQTKPQLPVEQIGDAFVTLGHTLPQPPQLDGLVLKSLSHPFAALLSQLPKPALQVNPQLPDEQDEKALVTVGHAFPHAPQWL
jgi:hypothetical protein